MGTTIFSIIFTDFLVDRYRCFWFYCYSSSRFSRLTTDLLSKDIKIRTNVSANLLALLPQLSSLQFFFRIRNAFLRDFPNSVHYFFILFDQYFVNSITHSIFGRSWLHRQDKLNIVYMNSKYSYWWIYVRYWIKWLFLEWSNTQIWVWNSYFKFIRVKLC